MMYIQHHNLRIVTGVMILVGLLAAATTHAQPRRDRRMNQVAPQALAQNAQPAPQCSADDANVARQHRRAGADAFDAHDWTICAAEYQVAQTRCPTAEAALNLGTCLENQGLLPQALEQYEALQRSGQLPSDVTTQQLQRLIDNVRSRLPRTPMTVTVVRPPVATACGANLQTDPANCGACGNRCNAGATCTAGQCRVVATTPPVATPTPRRSHLVPAILFAGAGALMATGIPLAIIAGNDAATLCDVQGRTTGCNRVQSGLDPRTVSTVAWVMTGTGAALAVAGLVFELLPQSRAAAPPHGITARPTAGLDRDGNPFFGAVGTF